ncbi:MAG: hypothetical protein ACYDGY_03265 [Acidimicrobiales bacterium]
MSIWAGAVAPLTWAVNYSGNAPVASSVIIPLTASGVFSLQTSTKAQVVVDVVGYG